MRRRHRKRQRFVREGELRYRIGEMLDEGSGFLAMPRSCSRVYLLQLDLQIYIELADSSLFERNESRGELFLRFVITAGVSQITGELKN